MTDDFPDHYWQRVDDAWAKDDSVQELVNLRRRESNRIPNILWPIVRTVSRTEREGD